MRTPGKGAGGRGLPLTAVPSERGTRRDLLIAAVIAIVMVMTACAIVFTGSAARSEFRVADTPQPVYGPATNRPTELRYLWSHESTGTGPPLTTEGNLVTVDQSGTVTGRDAGSGETQWSYSHPGRLCAVTFYAGNLVAAHDGAQGCSDVTALDPTAQEYTSTRQSAFPDEMTLQSTWTHALAFSPDRLEIWRDDLVRTVEYGTVEAPQEPDMQPRPDCTLVSAGLTGERFAVTERCPGDDAARLTISETVPEDSRAPEDIASGTTGADGLWIIDVRDDGVLALANRGTDWAVEWFVAPDDYWLVLPLAGEPRLKPTEDSVAGDRAQIRWFDGSVTHAFDMAALRHAWTVTGASGPGMTGGWSPDPDSHSPSDWVLVPTGDGLVLLDHHTGREDRRFETTSADRDEVIGLSQVGDILYERRAGAIHAHKLLV